MNCGTDGTYEWEWSFLGNFGEIGMFFENTSKKIVKFEVMFKIIKF